MNRNDTTSNPASVITTPAINRTLVKPTWIVLIVGWAIMLIPFPGTGIIGVVVAGTAGSILSIVNIIRGVLPTGIIQLLCAVMVSPIVYLIAEAIFASIIIGSASQ